MKPEALLVYVRGQLVVAKLGVGPHGPSGYWLPDGTVLRWLVW